MNTLLRLPAAASAAGMGQSTVWLRIKNGLFPRAVKISARAVAWPSAEIAAINAARIAGKTDAEIRELVAQLEQQRAAKA